MLLTQLNEELEKRNFYFLSSESTTKVRKSLLILPAKSLSRLWLPRPYEGAITVVFYVDLFCLHF